MPPRIAAVIPAGGIGLRMGGSIPKQFMALDGKPVLVHTLESFQRSSSIDVIILVLPATHVERGRQLVVDYPLEKVHAVIPGGATRQESVLEGIRAIPSQIEYVVIHDGARPFVSVSLIERCLAKAMEVGAAIAAIPVSDTLKKTDANDLIAETINRHSLWQAQTPQAAKLSLLMAAYEKATEQNKIFTDEASLLENAGNQVAVVEGSSANIKITRPEDMELGEAFMGIRNRSAIDREKLRIGHGFDAHRLVEGRLLILGGVQIPHPMGLLGHSDADVLIHALCDALLGALGAGDLGLHFPDNDPRYKGIASTELLKKVVSMMEGKGNCLVNADITMVAQRPKLAPYISSMRKNVAAYCMVDEIAVNIKATTTEKMGFTGREEGISAHAVVLLGSRESNKAEA